MLHHRIPYDTSDRRILHSICTSPSLTQGISFTITVTTRGLKDPLVHRYVPRCKRHTVRHRDPWLRFLLGTTLGQSHRCFGSPIYRTLLTEFSYVETFATIGIVGHVGRPTRPMSACVSCTCRQHENGSRHTYVCL